MKLIEKENLLAHLESQIPGKCQVCQIPLDECFSAECAATNDLIQRCRDLEDEIIEMKASQWRAEDGTI